MFLSQKNAIYFNKPKTIDPARIKRMLAGNYQSIKAGKTINNKKDKLMITMRRYNTNRPTTIYQLMRSMSTWLYRHQPNMKGSKSFISHGMNWTNAPICIAIGEYRECEKRLIEDIVQPGGIRIKPNDNMLAEFMKETKGMETYIIGCLLLSKLEANYSFQIKAKALYTIEYLIKKNDNYLSYFKAQVDKIKQSPQPEDNTDNFRKILKTVLNIIGISSTTGAAQDETKTVFVDPGYNDEPKSSLGNFIQSNGNKGKKTETKKTIIGPGQNKPKKQQLKIQNNLITNNDFLSLDLLGTQTKQTSNFNLQNEIESSKQQSTNLDLLMFGNIPKQDKSHNNFLF